MSGSNLDPSAAVGHNRLLVHATAVALGPVAALLRGPSGAGKSDLALRFLAARDGWTAGTAPNSWPRRLVADDQIWLTQDAGRLIASAPQTIAGKLEVRGVGIVPVAAVASAQVRLVVDLVALGAVERLPDDAATITHLGCEVRWRALAAFEASAAEKLTLLLAEFLR